MAVRNRKAEDESVQTPSNVIEAPITPRRMTVSEILRARRIECDLDIVHVANILRIREAVLVAIESGDFDQLPGPAYAVGFVRSYASYLGLDSEALVIRFKAEAAEMSRRPNLSFPLPIKESHVPTKPLIIICIVLAVLTYGGWYYSSMRPDQFSDLTPTVPDRLRHLLTPSQVAAPAVQPQSEIAAAPKAINPSMPAEPQASGAPQTAATASSPPAAPASSAAAVQGEPDGVPPVEARPGAPAVVAAPLPPAPDLAQPSVDNEAAKSVTTSYGAPDGDARVVLHASADSWIQVRDKNGNLIFTRVLKSGEHYNVPNQAGLTLIAGNAGGLDVSVDGMSVPRIGDPGKVVRNVSLDPDHLLGPDRQPVPDRLPSAAPRAN